ncbi:MAG TPA: hypothetical protein PLJ62_06870 [Thermoflexales bacterium]|nr:hypothetical protein [Thermoflexales bacterium]
MEEININAVEMTRQIRDRIYEQTRGFSSAELIAFYRERAKIFNSGAATRKRKMAVHSPAAHRRKKKIKVAA